jgi:hypothetical protein
MVPERSAIKATQSAIKAMKRSNIRLKKNAIRLINFAATKEVYYEMGADRRIS